MSCEDHFNALFSENIQIFVAISERKIRKEVDKSLSRESLIHKIKHQCCFCIDDGDGSLSKAVIQKYIF